MLSSGVEVLAGDMKVCSACLVGVRCRYDGGSKPREEVVEEFLKGLMIPVCPEALGGLSIPRHPSEIAGGDGDAVLDERARVLSATGEDVTDMFLEGAARVTNLARLCGAKEAILKDGSPSCGITYIYDGSFSNQRRPGCGVTAAALKRIGVRLIPVV